MMIAAALLLIVGTRVALRPRMLASPVAAIALRLAAAVGHRGGITLWRRRTEDGAPVEPGALS